MYNIILVFKIGLQSFLSQDKLEALEDYKKSEHDKFYNELQNRVNRVFNEKFKDVRKVTPLLKVNKMYTYLINT